MKITQEEPSIPDMKDEDELEAELALSIHRSGHIYYKVEGIQTTRVQAKIDLDQMRDAHTKTWPFLDQIKSFPYSTSRQTHDFGETPSDPEALKGVINMFLCDRYQIKT